MPPSPSPDTDGRTSEFEWSFNTGPDRAAASVAFDESALAHHGGRQLAPQVTDLVELAAAIHMVDRLSKRPSATRAGDPWSRMLALTIGVREPERWSRAEVAEPLHDVLRWLTDDVWTIRFVPREAGPRPAETILYLFDQPPEGDSVALFSGGLDSAAGLAYDADCGGRPIAFGVASNNRMRSHQAKTLKELNVAGGHPIRELSMSLKLKGGKALEDSQRSRGFVFLSLACAAAAALRLREVRVYENGIGAINLPYTAAQTGAHGTHSMHPQTLDKMANLLSLALDTSFDIVNPSQPFTKAQMCARLHERYHPLVQASRSCDTAASTRTPNALACGICTSCLLRRQALFAAGLMSLDEPAYRLDLLDQASWGDKRSYNLKAMVSQAARLRDAVSSDAPIDALVRHFPDLALWTGRRHGTERHQLECLAVQLFSKYAEEWSSFPHPQVQNFLGIDSAGEAA
jgi:7-cyano-7-deazaguanine synthase in queuosine biosynthesis